MLRIVMAVALLLGWSAAATAQDAPAAPAPTGPVSTTVAARPHLPTETFAKLPFVDTAEISPDGTQIAGLFAVNGEQRIVVMPLGADRSTMRAVAVPDLTEVDWVRWVNDDNVVIGLRGLLPVEGDRWYVTRLIAINRTTGKITKLMWDLMGQDSADVLRVPADGSDEILVAAQGSIYSDDMAFWPTVYRVNVVTGKRRVEEKGRINVLDWGADASGQVRFGIGYQDRSTDSKLIYRPTGGGGWQTIDRARLRDEEALTVPFLFVPGTDNGMVLKDDTDGKTIVAEINLLTGADVRTVYAADGADVESVFLSADGSRLLGVRTSDRNDPLHWIDPAMAEIQNGLDAAAPSAKVRIQSFNRDQSRVIALISTPDNPGLLYFYDAKSKGLTRLAAINETIGAKRLARSKLIHYHTRDGLEIEAVLTLPPHREPSKLPFIVMPHGGPWAHDDLGYDYWVQFLANMGYAVLQPNFRGSTGYGAEFERRGQGALGLAMQDDVSDGVKWAVDQGIADAKRVCIVGASYGGYAAMWGIAKDPDQYRCAISIAGVSNLRREVDDFGGYLRKRLYREQWQRMTPDFAAVSPINAIDRIRTPLLLIHGKKDVTVDHVQSDRMNAAMVKAGKSVEFVSIPLADHYFTREEDRLTLLRAMEAFLNKNNPPD